MSALSIIHDMLLNNKIKDYIESREAVLHEKQITNSLYFYQKS
jgi:hypothetical protein